MNHFFQTYTVRAIGDGGGTLFWEDEWMTDGKLADQFARLYNITFSR